jgi:DNA-binding LytR/AlgR family response regulator
MHIFSKGGEAAMNTPLKIAVCEDCPADTERLLSHIAQSGIAAEWEAFSSGEALTEAFRPGKYDLIFLDIYLGGMRGVDAAAEIRKADRTVTLVFTTTSTEHTLESYRMKAAGYLEKPVQPEDVRETLELALAKRNTAAYITLLSEGTYRKIPVDSILFFEQQNHAVMIHTGAETLRASQTVKLSHIEPLLPEHFFRCHHSYIVNLSYIREADRELKVFIMQDGSRVHIRHQSLKKAVQAYENCLFAAVRGGGR